nr:Chain C, LEDGF peptide [synthetic construct]3WNE_D Chain D, LEDGF peptide [synthetic construct]
PKIDNG